MATPVNQNFTWIQQSSSPIWDGNYPASIRPPSSGSGTAVSLPIVIDSAGRIGFFLDYSERSGAGTHTFYVCRTHGTAGAVSVSYATGGDSHNAVSGTLNWADGEADIKWFTVEVTAAQLSTHEDGSTAGGAGLGDHRIWALLSSPTGGAALHFGVNHTRAYGVIDTGATASNANAVFYDSTASAGGNGSRALPYNNIKTAIDNLGSKRYLYGKGVTVIDNTFDTDPVEGFTGQRHIRAPATRAGETTRAYIQNWPGNTWTVQGDGGNTRAGFWGQDGKSYHTYRGIAFQNLDTSGNTLIGFGILYHYTNGNSVGINIELCTADNINGGTNDSAFGLWGVDGYKVWRCTGNNIQNNGSNTSVNTAMFYTYDGKNGSVQRCEATNCGNLIYHKRVAASFDTTTSVRFCIDQSEYGIHWGASGGSGVAHSYSIAQCNLLKPYLGSFQGFGIYHAPGISAPNNSGVGHWWANNVFDDRAGSFNAPIDFFQADNAVIFNNIFYNCSRMWAEQSDRTAQGADVLYADYNMEFAASNRYKWRGTDYNTIAALQAASAYADNDFTANPLFTDAINGDYTLQGGSSALTGGVGNTQMGLYLGNFYTIGA